MTSVRSSRSARQPRRRARRARGRAASSARSDSIRRRASLQPPAGLGALAGLERAQRPGGPGPGPSACRAARSAARRARQRGDRVEPARAARTRPRDRRRRRRPSTAGRGPARHRASSMACRLERRRATSKHRTAAAVDTLRDSAPPAMGMVTRPSRRSLERGGQPARLVAEHQGQRRAQVDARCRAVPPRRPPPPGGAGRGRRARRGPRRRSPATTTGTWSTEPAEARTVFGLKGSTVPSQHTTPSAPAASATRMTAPALPGSRTSTHTTTNVAPGQLVEGGRRASRTTASTGWGVTVSATRSSTPGPRSKTRAPAPWRARARPTTSGSRHGAGASTKTASTAAPASSAPARSLTPSTTNAPSDRRDAAPPQQPPQALDPLVPEGERRGQERVPGLAPPPGRRGSAVRPGRDVATPTRRAKASGSVTARSARTLRSTSTSASRSPAMSRL